MLNDSTLGPAYRATEDKRDCKNVVSKREKKTFSTFIFMSLIQIKSDMSLLSYDNTQA